MLEVVLSIFVLCLAVVGLIEIFKVISVSFFNTKNIDGSAIFLIPIYGHDEEIEMILRNAMSNAKWFSNMGNRRIVCLDLGMDEETRQICEIISEEHTLVEVYSLDEFNEIMEQSVI